ncbi:hypothetical protein DFJ58DRAFT_844974 [Suillus subalutaceus]|uniref:uncharacterized protein n=1 Tax=Suillus subalutaceus TaxID=48586 RepID=UPI001B87DFB7|nr:uncharacterized protein DFJ58DRAFT_844974 [Suillus subalutaceus]KAG1841550.1 hypothetical protein DFJ58DRAFT_844974 [Suillus subalutaceus]
MRLSFVVAVVAAFKLTSIVPGYASRKNAALAMHVYHSWFLMGSDIFAMDPTTGTKVKIVEEKKQESLATDRERVNRHMNRSSARAYRASQRKMTELAKSGDQKMGHMYIDIQPRTSNNVV